MTDAVKPIVDNLSYNDIDFEYFTAPEKPDTVVRGLGGEEIKGIPSIDNGEDSANSALYCLPSLKPLVPKHDAFLVACYSADPLVGMLKGVVREYAESRGERCRKYVTGIFEASVAASLALVSDYNMTVGLEKSTSSETFWYCLYWKGVGEGTQRCCDGYAIRTIGRAGNESVCRR